MTLRSSSGLHLIEEVLEEMVTVLKNNLPTKLSALSTAYPDQLLLPPPADHCYYTPTNAGPSSLNIEYPSVFVIGGRVKNNAGEEGMHAGGFGGDMELAYSVGVFILCKGDTEETLQKYLYRYSLAVVEVLVQNDSLPIGECFLDLIDYENPQISTQADLIRDVPINFTVFTNESY